MSSILSLLWFLGRSAVQNKDFKGSVVLVCFTYRTLVRQAPDRLSEFVAGLYPEMLGIGRRDRIPPRHPQAGGLLLDIPRWQGLCQAAALGGEVPCQVYVNNLITQSVCQAICSNGHVDCMVQTESSDDNIDKVTKIRAILQKHSVYSIC